MTTRPSHAALVEEVAKALASFWPPHNPAQRNAAFDSSAEAAIAVIAARLSGVTPEMVEAVAKALCEAQTWPGAWINANEVEMSAWRFQARAAISAFLAASPLAAGEDSP